MAPRTLENVTAAVKVILTSIVLAVLILMLSPGLRVIAYLLSSYARVLHRPTLAWVYIALIIALALFLFSARLSRRLWRSLRLGLISLKPWFWVASLTTFWILLDSHLFRAAFVVLIVAVGFTIIHDRLSQNSKDLGAEDNCWMDPDLPVPEDGRDLLERGEIVSQLATIVVRERPSVIALTGGYGDGKTSILNLTIGQLRKLDVRQRPIIVKFSPWLPGNSSALVVSLLNSIKVEILKEYLVPGFTQGIRQYARILLNMIPKGESFKELFGDASQQERVRKLTNYIAKMPRRILVALDDLDRMEAKELETVFKILRGSDELSSVTFICSFDPLELAKILKMTRRFQDMQTFLDKFFQTKVSVPKIDSSKRKELFLEQMSRLRPKDSEKRP